MIKKIRMLLSVAAALVFCGCLDYTDKVTINPDGSGVVHVEARTTAPMEMFDMLSMGVMSEDNSTPFPPLTKRAAAKLFPAKDFEVSFADKTGDSETNHVIVEAKFKDIAALLNSPYAARRALSLKIEGDKLVFKAKGGFEWGQGQSIDDFVGNMQNMFSAGQKVDTNGLVRFQFEVVMPGAVAESSGAAQSGNSAKWVVEKSKLDPKQMIAKLDEPMRATCPAAGIKFTPIAPIRLALENFNELPTNSVKATATIDAEKVKASAKFVPYSIHVTRSLDLSGAGGGGQQNAAVLTGAIILPAALTPQEWGEVKLEEVKDTKGKSLIPANDDENSVARNLTRFTSYVDNQDAEGQDEEEEDDNGAAKKPVAKNNDDVRHVVSISFNPPEWQTMEIPRIKATAALLYFGGSQVVKLAGAIPEKSIMKMDGEGSFSFNENAERALVDPKLTQLGLKLKLEHAMQQNDSLSMSLSVEGKNAMITGLQIYDAQGKPWPTTLNKNDFGEGISYSISVNGKPKPPLSIALLAPDAMTKVEVPILVEKVPIRSRSK